MAVRRIRDAKFEEYLGKKMLIFKSVSIFIKKKDIDIKKTKLLGVIAI